MQLSSLPILRSRSSVVAVLLAVLLMMTSPAGAAEEGWSRDDAAHLLRRAGFGGTPVQIDRVHHLGRDTAVDYLITGKLPAGAEAPFAHADLTAFVADSSINYRMPGPSAQFELQKLRAWWLDRMVRTDRPLEEKMTLFWHGLFTSGFREVRNVHWMANQNELFHHQAIGNYKRLTRAIIHDPAMLIYLNNNDNQKGRPNENLARELMELFTMGEGNGYTEQDIPEVARALTGMTIDRRRNSSAFIERQHDDGAKTIFGKTGNYKPDDVVDLIFDRPQPANYLAGRLWVFFGISDPSAQEITPVAEALRSSNWDLAPALRALFTHPSFYSERAKFVMIKSPVELEAMTMRLLETPPHPRMLMASTFGLRQLGEELFQPPNVKGWPGGERWITSSAITSRYSLATGLASGQLGANAGRFGGRIGFAAAKKPTPTTRPAEVASGKTGPAVDTAESRAEARQARQIAQREEEREKVQEEMAKIPPMPPASELVNPAKLFEALGKSPTAQQIVDSAVTRFLQRSLPSEKKAILIDALGHDPLTLGQGDSDRKVRAMLGLLMSTPEYQVE